MARRRQSSSEGGVNLDSLMDALTNVVAVLILVLILVQADVSKKVVQFLEGLQPATPEEVQASAKRVETLERQIVEKDQLLSKKPPSPKEIENEKRQLALLEKDVEENRKLLVNLEELKKLAKKAEAERNAEAKKTEKIQDDIAKLEALLDETPILKVDPTVVGIPASRPVPKNAEMYYAIIIHDRIHFIDPETPLEEFAKEFKREKRNFPNQRIKRDGPDRYIYQPGPIVKHFKGFDFKNSRNQKVELVSYPTSTRLKIVITPDLKNGGTALDDLKTPRNLFARILDKLRVNSRAVLIYYVHPNSFNTYLRARQLSDKMRVSAGWEVRGMSSYGVTVQDVEVKRMKEPPPPKPGGGGGPPNLPTRID